MISVLSINDKQKVKELFFKHNREYFDKSFAVAAKDNEEMLGYCLFYLDYEKITILEIEPQNDLALADGILRSAIHNAVFKNVMCANFDDKSPVELFRKLQFILSEEEKTLNVNKLFESCCSCADKNT